MNVDTPRGIRNSNPGNIRLSKTVWQGEAPDQTDPAFVVFTSPAYGIRALAKTLESYQVEDGCNTIRQIIDRWAPPNENNTAAYVASVARACGVMPDAPVLVRTPLVMTELVKAIIHQENGEQPYDDATIAEGLSMARIAVQAA